MEIKLIDGEKVINSWDYAKGKGILLTKSRYNLTVTNKRIISIVEEKNNFDVVSVNVSEIKGVTSYYGKQRVGIIKTFLTLCLALLFRKVALSVSLCMEISDYDLIANSTAGGFFAKLFGSNKKGNGVKKMRVDHKVAKEIVENLSTIIYNINNSTLEV